MHKRQTDGWQTTQGKRHVSVHLRVICTILIIYTSTCHQYQNFKVSIFTRVDIETVPWIFCHSLSAHWRETQTATLKICGIEEWCTWKSLSDIMEQCRSLIRAMYIISYKYMSQWRNTTKPMQYVCSMTGTVQAAFIHFACDAWKNMQLWNWLYIVASHDWWWYIPICQHCL